MNKGRRRGGMYRTHEKQNAILAKLFRPVGDQLAEGKTLHEIVADRGFELRQRTNQRGWKQYKVFDENGEPLHFFEFAVKRELLIAWLDKAAKVSDGGGSL